MLVYGYGYVRSTGTDAGLVRNRYGHRKGTGTGVVRYRHGRSMGFVESHDSKVLPNEIPTTKDISHVRTYIRLAKVFQSQF